MSFPEIFFNLLNLVAKPQENLRKAKKNGWILSDFPLRSNFNTRELNSRELFCFFGHRKNPSERFWRKLEEILPTILPELAKPKFLKSNRGKTKI